MTEKESEYDDGDEMAAVHWELDADESDPGAEVADVIAKLENCDTTDLPPIYDTIDHMVEKMFSNPPSDEAQTVLQFSYAGYRITLNQDGYATFMNVSRRN